MARGHPDRLQFNQSLQKVPTVELLQRLKALHNELVQLQQEDFDVQSLHSVSRDLVRPGLLQSKDKSIKAVAACCLAELLRLYAPDAPYTGTELRDIFTFFIRQLSNLTGLECPNYHEYFTLIESLATVKSATLMADVPDSEQLMQETFKRFFELAKPSTPKNVLVLLADILVQLIDEASAIPQGVTDILLLQFLPHNVKTNSSAFTLAVDVCSVTSERLQRYVAQYFTETILLAIKEDQEDREQSDADERRPTKARASVAETPDFIVAHELIKQINRSCPSLLTNVTPQLEEELLADDVAVRIIATRTLGDMFADKPLDKAGSLVAMVTTSVRSDLAKRIPQTWLGWLGRSRDKAPQVRLTVLNSCRDILVEHPELGKDIYAMISTKLTDPDDRVRAAACAAFESLNYEAATHAFDANLLRALADRIIDKKVSVQQEALKSLARLYSHAFGEIANGDPVAVERFAWIPDEILKVAILPDRELQSAAEKALHDYILPLAANSDDEAAWSEQFLIVTSYLSETGKTTLLRLARLRDRRPSLHEAFLDAAEKYNGGVLDNDAEGITRRLDAVCRYLASTFADPLKADADLHRFAKLNDQRLYKLLRSLMDPDSDLGVIIKNRNEVLRRVEAASAAILDTFQTFIRQSALLLLNKSSTPLLFHRLEKLSDDAVDEEHDQLLEAAEIAERILRHIAKYRPQLLVSYMSESGAALLQQPDDRLVQMTLEAACGILLNDPAGLVFDRHMLKTTYNLALNGTPLQAKFAATIIARVPSGKQRCEDLVKDIADALPVSSGQRLVAHLNALKRIAKHAVTAFDVRSEEITTFIKALIRRDVGSRHLSSPGSSRISRLDNIAAEWVPYDELPYEDQACLIGLRVLTNQCAGLANDRDAPTDTARQTVSVLALLLDQDPGNTKFRNGPGLLSNFRLLAAVSLLRLATHPTYDALVSQHFEAIAYTIQDAAFQVRGALTHKLVAFILNRRLHSPKYCTMLFLTVFDPDFENSAISKRCIQQKVSMIKPEERAVKMDMLLVRLLHLLAHHPDYSREADTLKEFVRYIEFFMDCLANHENISFLYHIAQRVKTVRDSESSGHSEALYILSDLAQYIIKEYAKRKNWTIESHPGSVKMPGDIFKPLPSKDVANDIRKTVYLSDEVIEALGTVGQSIKVDAPRKARNTTGKGSTSTKRKAASTKVAKGTKDGASKKATTATNGRKRVKKEEIGNHSEEGGESDDENAYASMDSEEERLQKEEDEAEWAREQERLDQRKGVDQTAKDTTFDQAKTRKVARAKTHNVAEDSGTDGGDDDMAVDMKQSKSRAKDKKTKNVATKATQAKSASSSSSTTRRTRRAQARSGEGDENEE